MNLYIHHLILIKLQQDFEYNFKYAGIFYLNAI